MQTTVIAPVQVHTAPAVVRRPQLNVCAVRGLGITQIVIGSLTFLLGILATAALNKGFWVNKTGGGVWGGLLFLTAGVIGTYSSFKPTNSVLNGFNMALNIISTVVCWFIGAFFIAAIVFYNSCKLFYHYTYTNNYNSYYGYYYYNYQIDYSSQYDQYNCFADRASGRGYYGFLIFLMVAEFIISIVTAAYCCNATVCCCGDSRPTAGVILHRPPPTQHFISTRTNQTYIPTASPYPTSGVVTTSDQYPAQQQTVMIPAYPDGPAYYGYNNNYPAQEQYNYTQALPPAYSQ